VFADGNFSFRPEYQSPIKLKPFTDTNRSNFLLNDERIQEKVKDLVEVRVYRSPAGFFFRPGADA
jgi:hypothetical protein